MNFGNEWELWLGQIRTGFRLHELKKIELDTVLQGFVGFADPFVLLNDEVNEIVYLVFEAIAANGKGQIGWAILDAKKFEVVTAGVLIKKDYHLSFPSPFLSGKKRFVCPEMTTQCSQLAFELAIDGEQITVTGEVDLGITPLADPILTVDGSLSEGQLVYEGTLVNNKFFDSYSIYSRYISMHGLWEHSTSGSLFRWGSRHAGSAVEISGMRYLPFQRVVPIYGDGLILVKTDAVLSATATGVQIAEWEELGLVNQAYASHHITQVDDDLFIFDRIRTG